MMDEGPLKLAQVSGDWDGGGEEAKKGSGDSPTPTQMTQALRGGAGD